MGSDGQGVKESSFHDRTNYIERHMFLEDFNFFLAGKTSSEGDYVIPCEMNDQKVQPILICQKGPK